MTSRNLKIIIKYIHNPFICVPKLANMGLFKWMSDENYIKMLFWCVFHKRLDLSNPITFNEKIQWLKLNDHKPIYTSMVDKYEAKKLVANTIGEKYIIPTLGLWNSFDEIDFSLLPNQFVLKCTHDSGGIVICKDKTTFDYAGAKKKIQKSLRNSFYWKGREWPYKNVIPRIIAEKYMEDEDTQELRDYKFFTFNGEAKIMYVASGRQKKGAEVRFDFFDMNYHHLPVINIHPNADTVPEKPEQFEEMKALAEVLSKGIPYLRVDFYEINKKVYFGEMTFYHMSGMFAFKPDYYDKLLGSWINLN